MGLLAWLGIGIVVGIAARLLLPGGDRGCLSVLIAALGAVAGGAAATALGSGGILDLDPLGIGIAALAAAVVVLALRLWQGRQRT